MSGKECCTNCLYFFTRHIRWVSMYYCTKDGTDRQIGEFSNYEGTGVNADLRGLGNRCCMYFKAKETNDER